jgi:hypothetical protein
VWNWKVLSVLSPRRHYSVACWPNFSVGELDLHLRTITCVGDGHGKFKYRSIDTDYQSNCITVIVFISTNLFVMRALSGQKQSAMYGNENVITSGSLTFPVSCVPRLARAVISHQVQPEPSLAWFLDHLHPPPSGPPPNRCTCVL